MTASCRVTPSRSTGGLAERSWLPVYAFLGHISFTRDQADYSEYALSEGGRGEPKEVGRVTPCAPLCPGIGRRARSDAPYPSSLRHYYSAQYLIDAKYQNVKKAQIGDCTLAELSGNKAPFAITPAKYYDNGNGQLWIATADVSN